MEEMDNPYIRTLPTMTDDGTISLLAALNRFQVFIRSSFEMGILEELGADVMDSCHRVPAHAESLSMPTIDVGRLRKTVPNRLPQVTR